MRVDTLIRSVSGLLFALIACHARAETKYLGVYYHGRKVGHDVISTFTDQLNGVPATRSESHWVTVIVINGQRYESSTDSVTWTGMDNRTLRDTTVVTSGGKVTKSETDYRSKEVETTSEKDGVKTHRVVPIDPEAIFEDTGKIIHEHVPQAGQTFTFSSYDDDGFTFNKVEMKTIDSESFEANGMKLIALRTEVRSAGSVKTVYTDPHGEVLRTDYPGGMVVMSEPKEVALEMKDHDFTVVELIQEMSVKTDLPIKNSPSLKMLYLEFDGADLSTVPSDEIQTVKKVDSGWTVDIHPPLIKDTVSESIEAARVGQEQWTKPGPYIQSDDPAIVQLAAKITQHSKNQLQAGMAIMHYVNHTVKPLLGVWGIRDALEVLKDKKGKCTDYSILTVALMRAAGIPCRLAVGFLVGEGALYYHEWDEMWDGHRWIGIDSVFGAEQFAACHVKLAEGSVDDVSKYASLDQDRVVAKVLFTKF